MNSETIEVNIYIKESNFIIARLLFFFTIIGYSK